jgi:multidrug resistance efflux pump
LDDGSLWRAFADAATPEAYYRTWLALQCRIIRGVRSGVVIVRSQPTGSYAPAAYWPDARRNVKHLAEVAERALGERHGLVIKREPEPGTSDHDRYDVAYPIQIQGQPHGVVAIDITARPEPEIEAVIRQLQWGAGWLEVLLHRVKAARPDPDSAAATSERLKTLLEIVTSPLGHERFYSASTAFVTALATRLDCDRVSLGFLAGGRARVRAVSHSAQFGKKTNLVQAIAAAMDEATDQHATIVVPPPPGAAARVTRAHETLARQSGTGGICTIPLAAGTRIVGALTLERPGGHGFDATTVEVCEAIAAVAGPVLELQRRDDRWLIGKTGETITRQLAHLVGPRHVPLKLGALVAAGVVALLVFATGEFRVSAKTVMEAGMRQAAVAPFNGYIKDAPARAGDLVRAGQTLSVLDDRELRLERLKWLSQQEQYVKQHQQALANRNAAQVNITSAQIDHAKAQIALLDDQLSKTRLLAATDGVVVSGDLSQSLGAPVERGQVLFEIAPMDAYRVALEVDERDVSEVAVGQHGHLLLSAAPTEALPFVVKKITPVSTAREGRNYFRVEATLERTPPNLRPGMEGVGKIEIAQRRLVWIWTRQAVNWVRLQIWTWLP